MGIFKTSVYIEVDNMNKITKSETLLKYAERIINILLKREEVLKDHIRAINESADQYELEQNIEIAIWLNY